MSQNLLSRFAANASTTYAQGVGLRYTDNYWQSQGDNSVRDTGFVPNTPISPIQMNTILAQTTLTSYILGRVLANPVITNKQGSILITNDISSQNTDIQANSIADEFINFLNRINNIRNNDNSLQYGETVWRSRQIAYGDGNPNFWETTEDGTLQPSSTRENLCVNKIIHFGGTTEVNATLTFNQNEIRSNVPIYTQGLTSNGNVIINNQLTVDQSVSAGSLRISGQSQLLGDTTIGSGANSTITINGDATFEKDITMGGGQYLYLGDHTGDETSSTINSGINVRIRSKYNTSGDTTSTSWSTRDLEDILYNIGTRLDNLGFDLGSVTPASTASVTTNWLRKQGTYVIGRFVATREGQGAGWAEGQTIFTIPEGFRPYESYTIQVGGPTLTTVGTGITYCTIRINTNGSAVWEDLSAIAMEEIEIQFGHSTRAWQN